MSYRLIVYFILLIAINILGIIRWRYLKPADRTIVLLMGATLISETVANYAAHRWHNNLAILNIYNVIEFFLISLYFNYSLALFRKRNIGIILGIAGFFISVVYTLFFQRITSIHSYFMLFEGTAIIIYCLLALHQILINEEYLPYSLAFFWLTISFLIYWSLTFMVWGIYEFVNRDETVLISISGSLLTWSNFGFYIAIAIVLLAYKRLKPSGA